MESVLYDERDRPDLALRYVSRDGNDTYALKLRPGSVRVSAPATNRGTSEGSDTRAVLWPPATPATRNHQTCATWSDADGNWDQQGLALRVRLDDDRLRTIVVAKNIYYGAAWQLNVYTWDSARDPYFVVHGSVWLGGAFGEGGAPRPLPWMVCARVDGRTVRVKGWAGEEAEPAWNDPVHSGSVLVPMTWVYPGKAGWYAGHIEPGDSLAMDNLETLTRSAPLRD